MTDALAKYEPNNRGGYNIFARWNVRGKFKQVETLPTLDMAALSVKQLNADGALRQELLRDTVDWDFEKERIIPPKKPRAPREPRETIEPVTFSFEE